MPFHSWLPEAHVEASTEGSILLSAVILKLGLYGILRFIPLMLGGPAVELMQKRLPFLALGALAAACSIQLQPDIKKIIAYSSVLHRTCGVAALFRATSLAGVSACYGALSHGVISAGLFLSVGMLQEKLRAREIGVL
jgi:NADH:ubiquinone oxidoreductase subunit 4 (subunit M)